MSLLKLINGCFIIALVISLILIIAIIFTNNYNRFKVYDVGTEGTIIVDGIYVETRIQDRFIINNLQIKNKEIKSTDTISVDVYFIENEN